MAAAQQHPTIIVLKAMSQSRLGQNNSINLTQCTSHTFRKRQLKF